jgi:hypothetical protein
MISHALRHPREGGGPSPKRQLCTRGPVMDYRLRGNDEIWDGDVAPIASDAFFASSRLRVNHI